MASCRYCGAEIGFGADATRLQVELRLCTACPPEPLRAALVAGVAAGAAVLNDDSHEAFVAWICPPYEHGSDAFHAHRIGAWAAHFAGEVEQRHIDARYAFDVAQGTLRPAGAAR